MLLDVAHTLGFAHTHGVELRNCSRSCATTARTLNPGEVYFSILEAAAHEFLRRDYCVEAWQGPPEDCVAWWRSRIPSKDDSQPRLAPTDVMLNLFEALEDRPQEAEFRYLLGLLLLRRKVVRHEVSHKDDQGREVISLHCQKRQKEYELLVANPPADQALKLQQQMFDLLYGDGEVTPTNPELPRESDD